MVFSATVSFHDRWLYKRDRKLDEWPRDHPYTARLHQLNRTPGTNCDTFRKVIEYPDRVICANAILGLIKPTSYLLDQHILRLEWDFLKEGGLHERMAVFFGPLHQISDVYLEIADSQQLMTNPAIIEAATWMYYDSHKGRLKRGTARDKPGGARRMGEVFSQFDCTWSLY
jgi:four helix bundle suffix protein